MTTNDDELAAELAFEELEKSMRMSEEKMRLDDEKLRLLERIQYLEDDNMKLRMNVLSVMKSVQTLSEAVDVALDVAGQKNNEEEPYVSATSFRDPAVG